MKNSGVKHQAHNVIIVRLATNIELPLGKVEKALVAIEAKGGCIFGIDSEQQAGRARQFGVFHSLAEQPLTGSTAVIASEQVDTLELEISGYVCHRQLRTSNDEITDGSMTGGDFGKPNRRVRIAEPMTVLFGGMRFATVLDDRSAVQNTRECFEKGCLAYKRHSRLIASPSSPNGYFSCHCFLRQ